MNSGDKLLVAKCEDLFALCGKYCAAVFSDFLDGGELAVIEDNVAFPYDLNTMLFGGFEESEKKILGVFPEWETPSQESFPIKCLRVTCGGMRKLSHRDYLGAVMSLGISSGKVGDIVVSDGTAHVFLHEDIARYAAENLRSVGREGVKCELLEDIKGLRIERKFRTFGGVCASTRLDAIVGAAAGISRSAALKLIESGKVKLNHREVTKTSAQVNEGDIISVRGYGRYILDKIGNETRSNRLHVTLKQYSD